MSRFSIKYKVREGDTYENLLQRFGSTLANAGIYGDEDLVINKEFNLGVNTREEAELLQKKDLEYQRNINKGIRQKNAKSFDAFWEQHGNDIMAQYGRDLTPEYATKFKDRLRKEYVSGSNSIQGLHDKAAQIQKEFWDGTFSNATTKQDMVRNAKEIQKNPTGANLRTIGYDNSGLQVKNQAQVEKELGRKLTDQERQHLGQHVEDYQNFLKLGKGKTYQDYLKYLEGEHKSAESTKDLTRNIATGITLGAAGLGAGQVLSGVNLIPESVKTIAGNVVRPIWNPIKTIGKDMVYHTIKNFIAPQVISYGAEKTMDYTNNQGWTNFDDTTKDLLATTLGFTAGTFGVDYLKNRITKGLLNSGKGYLLESGSKWSNLLNEQLKHKYTSLDGVHFNIPRNLSFATEKAKDNAKKEIIKQIKNLGVYTGTNLATYGLPEMVPGLGQYASHKFTGKSLGENLEQYTGIDSALGDMLLEGILSSGSEAYKHGFEYTKASMSGGKKGFRNNWNYFKDHAGRTDDDFNYVSKHPILGRLNAIRRALTLDPGHNYQMAIEASPNKLAGTQNYTPYKEGDVSPLQYLRYWFSGDAEHLGGKLQESGSFMLGNRDTSTGNTVEKLAKSFSLNDGRFENGRRMKIVTAPGQNVEQVLTGGSFMNMNTGKYEPIFIDGQINPNITKGRYSSRNNVFLDMDKNTNKGTMLDIDGHNEIKIRTADGKYGYLHLDVVGPGSGATGGGVLTQTLSQMNSKEIQPVVSITLSGNRRLNSGNSKSGINQVVKGMDTDFSDIDDFVLTLENMDSDNIVQRFGQKDENGNYINEEYGKLVEYKKAKEAERKANRQLAEKYKKGDLTEKQIKGLEKRRDNAAKKEEQVKLEEAEKAKKKLVKKDKSKVQEKTSEEKPKKKKATKAPSIDSATYNRAISWAKRENKPSKWNPLYLFNRDRRAYNKVSKEIIEKMNTGDVTNMGIQMYGL